MFLERKRGNIQRFHRGIAWLLPALAGGALAGAGVYFAGKKKKQSMPELEKAPQLTDYPVGKSVNDKIMAALTTGAGIGYPADYVERSTSPFIAERNAGFTQRELPALNAEYGARGLSRSTLAARDIGQAYGQKERDINTIMADAYLKNLERTKADQQYYNNLGYNFANAEAGIGAQNAGITNQGRLGQLQLDQDYQQAKSDNINQAIGTAISFGSSLYGNMNSNASNKELLDVLKREQTTRTSRPYTNPVMA